MMVLSATTCIINLPVRTTLTWRKGHVERGRGRANAEKSGRNARGKGRGLGSTTQRAEEVAHVAARRRAFRPCGARSQWQWLVAGGVPLPLQGQACKTSRCAGAEERPSVRGRVESVPLRGAHAERKRRSARAEGSASTSAMAPPPLQNGRNPKINIKI